MLILVVRILNINQVHTHTHARTLAPTRTNTHAHTLAQTHARTQTPKHTLHEPVATI